MRPDYNISEADLWREAGDGLLNPQDTRVLYQHIERKLGAWTWNYLREVMEPIVNNRGRISQPLNHLRELRHYRDTLATFCYLIAELIEDGTMDELAPDRYQFPVLIKPELDAVVEMLEMDTGVHEIRVPRPPTKTPLTTPVSLWPASVFITPDTIIIRPSGDGKGVISHSGCCGGSSEDIGDRLMHNLRHLVGTGRSNG